MSEPYAQKPVRQRRQRGDESRRVVLDQAVQIARIEGIEGLTFGRVAEAAGIPKSSVQVLFREREALQAQTLLHGAALFEGSLRSAITSTPDDGRPLRKLCVAWFSALKDDACETGCLVTSSTAEFSARDGALADLVLSLRSEWRAALTNAAEQGRQAGELKASTDVEQLLFEILALQAAANIARARPDWAEVERARTAVLSRLDAAGPT